MMADNMRRRNNNNKKQNSPGPSFPSEMIMVMISCSGAIKNRKSVALDWHLLAGHDGRREIIWRRNAMSSIIDLPWNVF